MRVPPMAGAKGLLYELDKPEQDSRFGGARYSSTVANEQRLIQQEFERRLSDALEHDLRQKQSLRLVSGESSDEEGNSKAPNESERSQSSSNGVEEFGTGSIQQPSISVSTRSIQTPLQRANTLLPNNYISALLYSRQSPSLSSQGFLNKKAEPKSNVFMHFGRK